MGRFVLTDVRLFTGGADLSGASNKAEIKAEIEDKDVTHYRSGGWKQVLGGLASAQITAAGQWEAGDPTLVDDAAWTQLGGRGPWTIAPGEVTAGALVYFTHALQASYQLGDAVGEVAPWTGEAKSSWPLVRGVCGHPAGTARTATGTGTTLHLGAVPAGKRLYAALHVLSAAGTSPALTVAVESDDASGMASPTTQLTFAAATAAGGQIARTGAAPVTDTWWRARWTIAGTSPSFMFVLALGIA